jgi:hypothetical protein
MQACLVSLYVGQFCVEAGTHINWYVIRLRWDSRLNRKRSFLNKMEALSYERSNYD